MTINIQVNVPEDVVKADQAGSYLNRALAAIGFSRSAPSPAPPASTPVENNDVPSQADKPARRNSRKPAEPAPAPETPVDDADVEAQDAADEQAEVEETRSDKAPLTTEDVKAAMGGYVKKFGMTATQEDGPKIFVEALGAPPAGEPYWKLSLMADADQAQLAKAVDTWTKATELNPLKRDAV